MILCFVFLGVLGDIQSVRQIVVWFSRSSLISEISRLPGGYGHVTDSKSISSNLTTIHHSIQIAIIRLMSLLLLDVQLAVQFRLSLIDEVSLFDDSMILLHKT